MTIYDELDEISKINIPECEFAVNETMTGWELTLRDVCNDEPLIREAVGKFDSPQQKAYECLLTYIRVRMWQHGLNNISYDTE